jgi:hypothetical protein
MRPRTAPLARLRRSRPARAVGVVLGALALLLQMGVALAHDPLGRGTALPWLGVPLCHVGAPQGNPSAPTPPDQAAPCPICLGLAASAALVLPPVVPGVVPVSLPVPLASVPPAIVRHARDVDGRAQPRAPPVFA